MSCLGASNTNTNTNTNMNTNTSTSGGVAAGIRYNSQEFPKRLSPRAFPAELPSDATPKEKEDYEQAKKDVNALGFREYWDAELRASIYLNEFVTTHHAWLRELVTELKPFHDLLREKKDEQLRAVLAISDEREPRFVEIIDQHDGEGAIKYWCGMLMIDPSARATYQLLRVGRRIGEIVVMCLKEKFGEPRPSQVCAAIVPMIDPPITPSFPAGHALSAYLMSMLMGATKRPGIQPDMLTALAKRVAQNRTVAGLHYPLDNEAGLKAAERVFAMLMSDDPKCQKFRDLLEAAQEEGKLPYKKPVIIPVIP